ncbi:hypothetical protein [Nocardioides sp.]|uniref:hypothetical protein n=1 Tax=Nocardioides sp. TaxID=35761 RepID=UPI001A1B57B9|nr:hypothetical protein [Nocardioides sp.]MBJ7359998.1 hypothetical protein [Nocardioides sp.]
MTDTEVKLQVLLLVVVAASFLVLAFWFFRHAPAGRWAVLGAVGAGLVGATLGIEAASHVENIFLDSAHIAVNLLIRDHVQTVLFLARAVGAVLLVLAFVESRRAATVGTGSIYGS